MPHRGPATGFAGRLHRIGFAPKLVLALPGYDRHELLAGAIAGVTVGVVALPLAMAFAISSGLSPQAGIYTAIVSGTIISTFGGSRVQIGGPTGALMGKRSDDRRSAAGGAADPQPAPGRRLVIAAGAGRRRTALTDLAAAGDAPDRLFGLPPALPRASIRARRLSCARRGRLCWRSHAACSGPSTQNRGLR